MFLKRPANWSLHSPVKPRALETPGRGKQHILFLHNKSPILLSETFCSPGDTGPASQPFQLALPCLPPIPIKWFTGIQPATSSFLFSFPPSLTPTSFRPFFFSPPSPPPHPGLPQSSITQGISFYRTSERNNSWIGL